MTGQWGFWDQFCWYSALPQCLGSNDRLDIVIQTITGSAVDVAHFAIAFALAPLPEKQHLPQGKVEILHSIYTSCKLCLHVAAFPQSGCGREAPEKEVKSVTYLEWHIWSQHNILAKSNGHFQASKCGAIFHENSRVDLWLLQPRFLFVSLVLGCFWSEHQCRATIRFLLPCN